MTDEMVPSNVEEWSGIDDESYVVVSEEHVVDGVANFMAKCIFSNPKAQVCFHSNVKWLWFVSYDVTNIIWLHGIAECDTRGAAEK